MNPGIPYSSGARGTVPLPPAVLGYLGKNLIMDLGATAITGFGAWYGGGLYDLMIRWD